MEMRTWCPAEYLNNNNALSDYEEYCTSTCHVKDVSRREGARSG